MWKSKDERLDIREKQLIEEIRQLRENKTFPERYKSHQASATIADFKPKQPKIERHFETEEELDKLRKELKEQEDYLKTFKYHEEIPQMSQFSLNCSRRYQVLRENLVFYGFLGAIISTGFANQAYGSYLNRYIIKRYIKLGLLVSTAGVYAEFYWNIRSMTKNKGVYSKMPIEMELQRHLDQKYNLFQHVDDIKYNDGYQPRSEYMALKQKTAEIKDIHLERAYRQLSL